MVVATGTTTAKRSHDRSLALMKTHTNIPFSGSAASAGALSGCGLIHIQFAALSAAD